MRLTGMRRGEPSHGPKSPRFKDHELILRVLALYETANLYERPLKSFLNHYLAANRDRTPEEAASIGILFANACSQVNEGIGTRAFRPVGPINAATRFHYGWCDAPTGHWPHNRT